MMKVFVVVAGGEMSGGLRLPLTTDAQHLRGQCKLLILSAVQNLVPCLQFLELKCDGKDSVSLTIMEATK